MGLSHLQKITSTLGISLFLLVTACGNSTKIEGFDSQAWQSDVAGCDGVRRIILEQVDLETELIGLSESEILRILGKPDRNQLYKRNQKFYTYDLGPCEESASPYFQIRFSATNVAREAMVYEP